MLCIYPEGTTTNQTMLLPFRHGAFVPGKPVSMMSIQYDCRFVDRSDASASMVVAQLRQLLGLYYTITITYFGDYVPDIREASDAALYAENVRRYYSHALGWPLAPYSYRDKYYFQRQPGFTYEGCSEEYKSAFGRELTCSNYTIRASDVREAHRRFAAAQKDD